MCLGGPGSRWDGHREPRAEAGEASGGGGVGRVRMAELTRRLLVFIRGAPGAL